MMSSLASRFSSASSSVLALACDAGGGDLDHAVDPEQLIAGGVFQVTVGGQGQLAVARVHGLRAVGEGEEAVTVDRQVQGVIGGGQAAGFEVLHHARDLGTQADVAPEYTSANCVVELLKPTVWELEMLLLTTLRSVDAADRPLSAWEKAMVFLLR